MCLLYYCIKERFWSDIESRIGKSRCNQLAAATTAVSNTKEWTSTATAAKKQDNPDNAWAVIATTTTAWAVATTSTTQKYKDKE